MIGAGPCRSGGIGRRNARHWRRTSHTSVAGQDAPCPARKLVLAALWDRRRCPTEGALVPGAHSSCDCTGVKRAPIDAPSGRPAEVRVHATISATVTL